MQKKVQPIPEPKPRCDFAETSIYAPECGMCDGPLLLYNDNARRTYRCERHARMVHVWAASPNAPRPIWKFLGALTPDQRDQLEAEMAQADLREYVTAEVSDV
jgi:hypothetical protein